MKPNFAIRLCIVLVLFGVTDALHTQIQDLERDQERTRRRPTPRPLQTEVRPPETQPDLEFQFQSLEAAVDPATYKVGPGDQFLINIWGLESRFIATVTPEGKLIVPTIGTLQVDGKPLAEVQDMVAEAGARKYIQSRITANLVRVRSLRVHVTGQVLNPGPYTALAVERVSDIIEKAGGLTTWGFERAIEVRHVDGTVDRVDLYRYHRLGDLDANLYVRGGDVIHVPAIDLTQPTVRVEGVVDDPGTYQLVENETLHDFLMRVDALSRRSDLRHAYIERRTAANGTPEIIPIYPYLDQVANGRSELYLKPGDVINVPQRQEYVYVIGAVRNPGEFPYVPELRVRDYVGLAGSTELATHLSKCKVIRRGTKEEIEGADVQVEPGDTVFVPRRMEFGVREVTAIVGQITSILIALKAVGVIK